MHLAGIGRGFHDGMGANCGKVYHQSRPALMLSELLLSSLTSFNSAARRVRRRSSRNQMATIAPAACGPEHDASSRASGLKGQCVRACCSRAVRAHAATAGGASMKRMEISTILMVWILLYRPGAAH